MRQDIYQEVTNSIIAALEAGARPWSPAWSGASDRLQLPLRWNGQPYKGVNVLVLWLAGQTRNSPRWLTFKQALELGGNVRKGEKSSRVVYVGAVEREREGASGHAETTRVPFLKSYAVFNADQCDGLPAEFQPAPAPTVIEDAARLRECEAFFAQVGASVHERGNQAYYRPATDEIAMPPFATFNSPAAFYSVLSHEHIHWTGAKSRLDRSFDGSKRFGGDAYAMEELVAELGAAFLCAGFGLVADTRDDHAGYLDHWLQVLRADNRAIFTAAAHAQRAVDYLLSLQPGAAVAADEAAPAELETA